MRSASNENYSRSAQNFVKKISINTLSKYSFLQGRIRWSSMIFSEAAAGSEVAAAGSKAAGAGKFQVTAV